MTRWTIYTGGPHYDGTVIADRRHQMTRWKTIVSWVLAVAMYACLAYGAYETLRSHWIDREATAPSDLAPLGDSEFALVVEAVRDAYPHDQVRQWALVADWIDREAPVGKELRGSMQLELYEMFRGTAAQAEIDALIAATLDFRRSKVLPADSAAVSPGR
jgi:hypothetical protein